MSDSSEEPSSTPEPLKDLPTSILPYRSEELFPKPPEVEAYQFLGNLAIALAVFGWSASIGLRLSYGIDSIGNFRAIGGCAGGLGWLISVTLAIGVAWRREIRGLIALVLDVLLFVGCWAWNLFSY